MHARILRPAKYLEYFIVNSLVILFYRFLYGLLGHKNMTQGLIINYESLSQLKLVPLAILTN